MSDPPLNGFSLKHTISCLKPEFQFYSPAYGAALLAPFLHRLYHSNLKQHATYELVQSSFSSVTKHDHIKHTVSKGKASYWLTPSLLGTLVASLENGSDTLPPSTLRAWNLGMKSKEKINEFLDIVRAAKLEEETTYFPHCVTYILVAFLWARAKDKLELWEFLNSVNEFYGSRIQILTSTSSEYKQMWLNARFSEAELAYADIPCWLQSGNFGQAQKMETLIAFHLGESKERRRLSPFFPPPIYYQNPSCSMNCGWTHADCVETAIRGMINILLYDPETKSFNLGLLRQLRPSERMYNFYNSPTVTPQRSGQLSLHSNWLKIVSDIAGVEYIEKKCEVEATLTNILKLLEVLFQSKKDQNWTYWGQRLSVANRLEVSISTIWDGEAYRIAFKVTRNGQVQSFTLHCWKKEHSCISYPLKPFAATISPNLLREYWSSTKESPVPFPTLGMLASWSPSMDLPRINELDANKQLLYLLSREHITLEDSGEIQMIKRSANDGSLGNLMDISIQN